MVRHVQHTFGSDLPDVAFAITTSDVPKHPPGGLLQQVGGGDEGWEQVGKKARDRNPQGQRMGAVGAFTSGHNLGVAGKDSILNQLSGMPCFGTAALLYVVFAILLCSAAAFEPRGKEDDSTTAGGPAWWEIGAWYQKQRRWQQQWQQWCHGL